MVAAAWNATNAHFDRKRHVIMYIWYLRNSDKINNKLFPKISSVFLLLKETKFTILYNISENQRILRDFTTHVVWVSEKPTLKTWKKHAELMHLLDTYFLTVSYNLALKQDL